MLGLGGLVQVVAFLLGVRVGLRSLARRGAPRVVDPNGPGSGKPAGTPEDLIAELERKNVKHSPDHQIVRIARLPDGRIVFLEQGNARAGLRHIVKEHGEDFARRGIAERQIPDVIMDALQQGERVGTRRAGVIYRMTIDGRSQYILIIVGSNGYIVTAYPVTF